MAALLIWPPFNCAATAPCPLSANCDCVLLRLQSFLSYAAPPLPSKRHDRGLPNLLTMLLMPARNKKSETTAAVSLPSAAVNEIPEEQKIHRGRTKCSSLLYASWQKELFSLINRHRVYNCLFKSPPRRCLNTDTRAAEPGHGDVLGLTSASTDLSDQRHYREISTNNSSEKHLSAK